MPPPPFDTALAEVAQGVAATPAGAARGAPAGSRPDIARGTTKLCTTTERYPTAASAPRAVRVLTLKHGPPPPPLVVARGLTGMSSLSLRVLVYKRAT